MACHYCNNEAYVYLPYAARELCEKHFSKLIESRFSRSLREEGLKPHAKVLVGLSGGKDSATLLYMLKKLTSKIPLSIVAVTIDEGIANYRSKSVEAAEKLCKELDIEHVIVPFSKEVGKSLDEAMEDNPEPACGYCGVFRRYLLNKAARDLKADYVAIGHNLDDAVQTVMMNLLRNEPSRIARFFKPLSTSDDFVPRLKPLIHIPEKEIVLYALSKGLVFDDGECPYANRSIRYDVRVLLNNLEDRYPGAKFRILRSALSIVESMKFEPVKMKPCSICSMPTNNDVCMFCSMKEKLSK
ncbi:MAG: TIGR00269 family protein [Methanobacteriota archaeon]|nr:MAG: TIGR00269 family protein [Euryarchaeota archaeon]